MNVIFQASLRGLVSLVYCENPKHENLPLPLQSISLNFPQNLKRKLSKSTVATKKLNA